MLAKFVELSFLVWFVAKNQFSTTIVGLLLACGLFLETLLAASQTIVQHSIGGPLYFFGERLFNAATPGIANASIGGQLFLRPYATFSHPNMFAGYALVVLLLIVSLLFQKKQLRVAVAIAVISGVVGLLLSLSRTVLVAGILAGLFVVSQSLRESITRKKLLLFLSMQTVILFMLLLFPQIISRLFSLSFGESLVQREVLATAAVRMILHVPFFGVGLNNFLPSLPAFSGNTLVLQPVHNIYLLIASETGFLGFLFFISLLWVLGKRLATSYLRSIGSRKWEMFFLLLALFAILFSGLFDHYFLTLQQGQLLFALVVGLIFRHTAGSHVTIQQ